MNEAGGGGGAVHRYIFCRKEGGRPQEKAHRVGKNGWTEAGLTRYNALGHEVEAERKRYDHLFISLLRNEVIEFNQLKIKAGKGNATEVNDGLIRVDPFNDL